MYKVHLRVSLLCTGRVSFGTCSFLCGNVRHFYVNSCDRSQLGTHAPYDGCMKYGQRFHMSNFVSDFDGDDNDGFVCKSNSSIDYHVPVMMNECCDLLNIKPGCVYVDCTMGGGGHTRAILERGGKVIGIDQDPDSIVRVKRLMSNYIATGDLEVIQTNFRNIKDAIAASNLSGKDGTVDGVLMDLGISSFQIDEASRGFAFSQDGPLDMRMNKGVLSDELEDGAHVLKVVSAFDIINTWDANDIADILYNYGDEVRSRVIAREIVLARPLNTTGQLESVISRVTQFKQRSKTLARCFQALRIVVNDEIGALEDALLQMHECIRFEGRFVVMSYHSLEDRRIKQLFRDGVLQGHSVTSGSDRQTDTVNNPWRALTKRAIVPSDEELQLNRRSRSAKLRCAEQIIQPKHHHSDDFDSDEVAEVESTVLSNYKNRKAGGAKVIGAKQLAKLRRSMSDDDE